uniref:Uncharacterized protein n=1 Tax=Tanacetum cinerariifolium TaxID=118510 RepID=A0A699HRW3_TANCI|nr:hypothetical protein [Tanacetum cinerariifolium]
MALKPFGSYAGLFWWSDVHKKRRDTGLKEAEKNVMKLKLLEDLSSTSSVKKPRKYVSNKKGKSHDVKKMIHAQIFCKSNSLSDEPAKPEDLISNTMGKYQQRICNCQVLARVAPEQE